MKVSRARVMVGAVLLLAGGALGATPARLDVKKQFQINLAWQIALDAANFSPGIIDGDFGRKGQMAMKEYAAARLPGVDPRDPKVFESLGVDVEHTVAKYKIADEDAAEVGALPEEKNWNEKSKVEWLPYESLLECLAEKFHCTKLLLERLNPGVKMGALDVGQEINVPNLRPFPEAGGLEKMAKERWAAARHHAGAGTHAATEEAGAASLPAARAEYFSINLSEKTIRVFDKEDHQLALFHCSVAKDKAKLPARDAVIRTMACPPEYTFFPAMYPEVTDVTGVLRIPPGPRNPVGLAWMGLDLPGYGMHGNPHPELIGKTGSHGCFRLTNWDALNLFGMAHVGMVVKIVNPEKEGVVSEE